MLDVAGERPGKRVPVEVVVVVDEELADREEVALDGVEVAGVGRRGHELDVGGGGEAAEVGGPVGREVVLDPVDASAGGYRGADLGHEGEVVAAAGEWSDRGTLDRGRRGVWSGRSEFGGWGLGPL